MIRGEVDLVLDHVFGRGRGVDRRLGLERALRVLSVYVYPTPDIEEIRDIVSEMQEIDLCFDAKGTVQAAKLNRFEVVGDWVGCEIQNVKGDEVDQASVDEVLSLVVRIAFAKHMQSLDVSNSTDDRMFC